ncbi:MAG: ABC transporter ATP-binding protein [Sulfuricurvum sp.]|nr:ABC transporter ATP-binding protein [Sulfuricurvum sp.]
MELKPIISTRDLYFSYPKHDVLCGIDFDLHKGEILSLLGPNGCGKSTLIRLMLRLLKGRGDVWLHNRPIERYSHREIARRIAYIPQYHSVPFNYTVQEMVMMGRFSQNGFFALPSAADRRIAEKSLERVGIAHLCARPFGQLSGGQKQLVLLARALAQEVDTFIMDEPVTGLDYGNQIRLLELISDLGRQGYTFLKTTHYPDHALLVSSRVVVMEGGKIIRDGSPEAVITPELIKNLYGVTADLVRHGDHARCLPIFAKGAPTA